MILVVIVGLLISASGAQRAARPQPMAVFVSPQKGFAVDYPASWCKLGWGSHALQIINFPPSQRVEGVIIKSGGALIGVSREAPRFDSAVAFDSWLTGGESAVRREWVEVTGSGGRKTRILTSISLLQVGPGSKQVQTAYVRDDIAGGPIAVILTTWQGDPGLARLQATALQMAESLRPYALPAVP